MHTLCPLDGPFHDLRERELTCCSHARGPRRPRGARLPVPVLAALGHVGPVQRNPPEVERQDDEADEDDARVQHVPLAREEPPPLLSQPPTLDTHGAVRRPLGTRAASATLLGREPFRGDHRPVAWEASNVVTQVQGGGVWSRRVDAAWDAHVPGEGAWAQVRLSSY